jgi:hypothetical protein
MNAAHAFGLHGGNELGFGYPTKGSSLVAQEQDMVGVGSDALVVGQDGHTLYSSKQLLEVGGICLPLLEMLWIPLQLDS